MNNFTRHCKNTLLASTAAAGLLCTPLVANAGISLGLPIGGVNVDQQGIDVAAPAVGASIDRRGIRAEGPATRVDVDRRGVGLRASATDLDISRDRQPAVTPRGAYRSRQRSTGSGLGLLGGLLGG